jgi:type III secretion YscU/HrpY family protein
MSQEKSEKPTQKRLRDARKKGQVAKSQDLSAAVSLLSAFGLLAICGTWMVYKMREGVSAGIQRAVDFKGPLTIDVAMDAIFSNAQTLLLAVIPLLGGVLCIAALTTYLQVGPVFSFETIKPNPQKLNPIQGFQQKFLKARTYLELVKTLLKLAIATTIIFSTAWGFRYEILALVGQGPAETAKLAFDIVFSIGIKVAILFLLIGGADFFLQKFLFLKEMKMSKHEVKEEYKETEGNPLHKWHRRRMHMEILSESVQSVKNASVVITNPTHLAVALRYERDVMDAPVVLAKGADLIAAQIRHIAEDAGVPIMRDVPLARALYELEIDADIPEELYEPVAVVLRWVYELQAEKQGEMNHVAN